ncbi:MAG: hypothetical protein ABIB43_04015 [archaeon]
MSFHILIPEIDSKPKNVKDAIILSLTLEGTQTAKKVYNQIKKQFSISVTYQAVFKAINELVEAKVLTKKDKEYEINIGWVKQVQSFTDIVETNHFAKKKLKFIGGLKESKNAGDISILNFETVFDAEKYLYYFIKTELLKKKDDKIFFKIRNEWRPLFYYRTEYNHYKRILEKGHKVIMKCKGNSKLEKEASEIYKKIGVNYEFIKEDVPVDIIAFLDYYIQLVIPNDVKKKITKYLNENNKFKLLQDALSLKSDIKIIITKDANIAEEVKNS